jgi:MFS family permease
VIRLSIALFLMQAGFHGFTVSIPLAMARSGRPDADIGAIVGVAAVVQIAAALVGGALIDRFGAIRLFVAGGLCYLGATLILLVTGIGADATPAVVVARLLQGTGFGLVVPSVLSVVPSLVPAARRGMAIATAGSAHNITFVALPPLSLAVLNLYGLPGVTIMVAAFVVAALALALARPITLREHAETHLEAAKRRFGFAWRGTWFAPLAIVLLFVLHWGVVIAYLPQRAEVAGADISLFFVADGLFVLLMRIPAGWLADRVRPLWPVLAGIALTFAAVALLFAPPTTPVLILSGSVTGVGAALIVQPLMLALTARSGDADRGSAFALFNATFSAGLAIGTIGTAPLIATVGYGTLLATALVALVASGLVACLDRGLRSPVSGRAKQIEAAEGTDAGSPIGP